MGLQNLGNTCWMSSLLQCLLANPLLQKWFLSSSIAIHKPKNPVEVLHVLLTRLFLAQLDEGTFNLAEFVLAVWCNFPILATPEQHDSSEFFIQLRSRLDEFYQKKFDQPAFASIFEWKFKVIESCEYCSHANRPHLETSGDLILHLATVSTLQQAVADYLLGTSPKVCSSCQNPCRKQCFFATLPPTLSVTLIRGPSTNPFTLSDELDLTEFVDRDISENEQASPVKYRLIGEVVRPGQGEHGHYWANVLKAGQWWRCDDNSVVKVSKEEALRDDASLLFFVREGFVSE